MSIQEARIRLSVEIQNLAGNFNEVPAGEFIRNVDAVAGRIMDLIVAVRHDERAKAVTEEREACAKLVDEAEADCRCGGLDGAALAARIRARGEKKAG